VAIGLTVVAAVAAVAAFVVPRLDASADPEEKAVTGELMAVSERLLGALDHERLLASLDQVGHARLLVLPVEDTFAARRVTDEVLVEFESTLAGEDARVRSHYDGALDAVGRLEGLRAEIDGRPAPAPGLEYAVEVFRRYDEIVGALREADTSLLGSTVDDAELRHGLELLAESWHASDATSRLIVAVAFDIGRLTTPEVLARVSAVDADMKARLATAAARAARTPYAGAAEELQADLAEAELQQLIDSGLQTGQVEIYAVVAAALSASDAWQSFANEVEDTMTEPLRT
jgi:hypothetical protein